MIEIEASSLDQALKRAELALGLEREYIRYEIDTARTSLFGTRDRRIVIRACPDQKLYHPALSPFLQSFRELSGLDVLFSFPEGVGDKDVSILVEGADSHLFDEREGELLIALQYVLNKAFGEKMGRFILLDTRNEFRQKREQKIHSLTYVIERELTQKSEFLTPRLNPSDRKVLHQYASDRGYLSESQGTGYYKRMKIVRPSNNTQR